MIHVELNWSDEDEQGLFVTRVRTDDFLTALTAATQALATETSDRNMVEVEQIRMAVDEVPEIDP